MRSPHIRTTDLNLLPALAILLEERQVSGAAARYHLSQPAMSRLLQRLRDTFGDELLVRGAGGYEPTARGRRLQDGLRTLLPQIEALLRGGIFDPATATDTFRMCCPDYAALLVGPALAAGLARLAPGVSLDIVAWHDDALTDLARGRLDVALWADAVPPPLRSAVMLEDEIVCVMAADHPLAARPLDIEAYLACRHVLVTLRGNEAETSRVDRVLAARTGRARAIGLSVPFFATAVSAVAGTELIATVPRMAAARAGAAGLVIRPPPVDLAPVRYLMAWHPRSEGDPAQDWFRGVVAAGAARMRARAPDTDPSLRP